MIDLEYINNYLDKNYNNKRFKIGNSKYFTSFRIEKTRDFLKRFKKDFRKGIDKEYFSSLCIHGKYFDLDKIIIEDDNLEKLFNKSIQWIDKHFIKSKSI